MTKPINALLILSLILSMNSCFLDPDYYKDSKAYRVEVNNLNVRYKANTNSRVLGMLNKGDTIYVKSSYQGWKVFWYKGYKAYVDSSYLVHLEKPEIIELRSMSETSKIKLFKLIDEYSSYKKWQFWVITIVLLFVSLILFIIGMNMLKGEENVDRWEDMNYAGMNYLPYISLIIGLLFGIVYYFWPIDIQVALFVDYIWFWPSGKGFLYWYLWLLFYIFTISAIILSIYDLVAFRAFAFWRIIYFLFVSVFVILTMIFVSHASIVILMAVMGIMFLLNFFSAGAASGTPVETDADREKKRREAEWEEIRKRNAEEEHRRLMRERKRLDELKGNY